MQSKTVILLKHTNTIQLGHLYEHLFCGYLEQFLIDNGIYPYLDYSLTGKTYHGGVIYIECTLYTEKAVAFADTLSTIQVDFSDSSIKTHFSQLLAEYSEPFGSKGIDEIRSGLEALHKTPWQDADTYAYTDFKQLRIKTGPLYIAEGSIHNPKKVITSISFDLANGKTDRIYLPVFRQLAYFVNSSLQASIPFELGFFSYGDTFNVNSKKAIFTNEFHVHKNLSVNLEQVRKEVSKTISTLLTAKNVQAFSNEMKNLSYTSRLSSSPDIGRNYENTLFIVGAKGWKELATVENIKYILKNTTVTVRHGNTSLQVNL